MKDKTARILAIIALVMMVTFVVSLCLSLAGVVAGVFTYVAIGSAAVALVLFVLIKMSGRGYSITQMNNEIEMEKLQKEMDEQIAREQAEKAAMAKAVEEKSESDGAESAEKEPEAPAAQE